MNRRIMVEVTPQEYEKIQAGKLNADDMTVAQLVNRLVKKLTAGDVEVNVRHHTDNIRLSNTDLYEFKINEFESAELSIKREIIGYYGR